MIDDRIISARPAGTQDYYDDLNRRTCRKKLECGGSCARPPRHEGPCMCLGDEWPEPGTCPA